MQMRSRFLSSLASAWPNPKRHQIQRLNSQPGTKEFARAYGIDQFMSRVCGGLKVNNCLPPIWGKEILEIGCGHGGITCFLGCLSSKVVGIDLNTLNLEHARHLAKEISASLGHPLPVDFLEMDAHDMTFNDAFDLILADNLFEHVNDPKTILTKSWQALRSGGYLLVPSFSSIWSKYGLHLKNGLKIPWLNLFFSDQAIIEALELQAQKNPLLYNVYPGLKQNPQTIRDVRRYKDLNSITYRKFKELATETGFEIVYFHVNGTRLGKLLQRFAPRFEGSFLQEVYSLSASAILRKPKND